MTGVIGGTACREIEVDARDCVEGMIDRIDGRGVAAVAVPTR